MASEASPFQTMSIEILDIHNTHERSHLADSAIHRVISHVEWRVVGPGALLQEAACRRLTRVGRVVVDHCLIPHTSTEDETL